MLFILIFSYFAVGLVAGLMSGLLGLGGGIIVVPALAWIFSQWNVIPQSLTLKMAIGTSLAIMVITLTASVYAHQKHRGIHWLLVKRSFLGLLVGVILGNLAIYSLSSTYLRVAFSLFLMIMALNMLLQIKKRKRTPLSILPLSSLVLNLTATTVGFISSLLGAGGGTLWVPFFLRARLSMQEAVGTSVACGLVTSLMATLGFLLNGFFYPTLVPWSTSYIYWPAFFCVALLSVIFAPIGAYWAQKLPQAQLKSIFAIFILLIAIDMMLSS